MRSKVHVRQVEALARVLIAVFLLLLLASTAWGREKKECSWSMRWDVKTLSDQDAGKINFHPEKTTIRRLTNKRMKFPVKERPRMQQEFKTYEVTARIKFYSVADDGDLNLILADPRHPGETIIAELPDPDCDTVKGSPYKERFRRAWREFRENCAIGGEINRDGNDHKVRKGLYTVTGVAFFDMPHFQEGESRNDIELHPILSIRRAGR
jgi:hypothetical protein